MPTPSDPLTDDLDRSLDLYVAAVTLHQQGKTVEARKKAGTITDDHLRNAALQKISSPQ